MTDLDDLRTFVAVADAGSVSLAATKLHVSQPAVSRRVQRLEAALGVQLLDRRAKPVMVTAAGRGVLERSRGILTSVEDLRLSLDPEPVGVLRVGISLTLATTQAARSIDDLGKTFPRVALQVTTAWTPVLLDQLREGTLDAALVAVAGGQPLPPGVTGARVGRRPLVFIRPRKPAFPRTVGVEDLAGSTWVLNPAACACVDAVRRMLHQADIPLRVGVAAYGWELQLSLVARGAGLSLVPRWVLRQHPFRDHVRPFVVEDHEVPLDFWVLRGRASKAFEPVTAALERILSAALARLR